MHVSFGKVPVERQLMMLQAIPRDHIEDMQFVCLKVKQLPPEIWGTFPNLKKLYLRETNEGLQELPQALTQLKGLEHLAVSMMPELRTLPKTYLSEFPKLKSFWKK